MLSLITDAGMELLLGILFNTALKPTTITLRLFVDQYPLSRDNNINTRILASGGGYSDITIDNLATISTINGSVVASFPKQTWTFTGILDNGRTIYGMQVISDNTLIWEESFQAFRPGTKGGVLSITPRCRFGNI